MAGIPHTETHAQDSMKKKSCCKILVCMNKCKKKIHKGKCSNDDNTLILESYSWKKGCSWIRASPLGASFEPQIFILESSLDLRFGPGLN